MVSVLHENQFSHVRYGTCVARFAGQYLGPQPNGLKVSKISIGDDQVRYTGFEQSRAPVW